ncbi:Lrp/AsnC family transcriptional regulator [Pseudarthrobacter sp. NIBRBAC000502772]|nr:Lrp/AsnC family transcriptional regulator [Pseudarthrobacter sp. NIBRBAC000502772]
MVSPITESDSLPTLDPTDLKILLELIHDPRIQIGELAEVLGIARNTAQSRVRRLLRAGVLHDGGREIDLEAVGYDVVAFVTIEVTHRELDGVVGALRLLPQVLEVHEISGRGDVWCRVVATDTHNLQSALRLILRIKGVIRTETVLALHTHIPYRTEPLIRRLAQAAPGTPTRPRQLTEGGGGPAEGS